MSIEIEYVVLGNAVPAHCTHHPKTRFDIEALDVVFVL
jgi:hypothetical protein